MRTLTSKAPNKISIFNEADASGAIVYLTKWPQTSHNITRKQGGANVPISPAVCAPYQQKHSQSSRLAASVFLELKRYLDLQMWCAV